MKIIFTFLSFVFCFNGLSQSSSTNYSSNIEGYFTHGEYQTGTNSINKIINVWTVVDSQSSVNYVNKMGNGVFADTNSIAINDIFKDYNLVLHPNPFKSKIHFELPNSNKQYQVAITDIHGKEVFISIIDFTTNSIDLSLLSSGIYFIQFENGGNTAVRKIVKTE